jgi:hypothetical protein
MGGFVWVREYTDPSGDLIIGIEADDGTCTLNWIEQDGQVMDANIYDQRYLRRRIGAALVGESPRRDSLDYVVWEDR